MSVPIKFPVCNYPDCNGLPKSITETCPSCKKELLHHLCQTGFEAKLGIELPLMKVCFLCVKDVILNSTNNEVRSKGKKYFDEQENKVSKKRSDDVDKFLGDDKMPSLDVSQNSSVSSVSCKEKKQKGFMGNTGIFCEEVIFYGQKMSGDDDNPCKDVKFGFGIVTEVPNRKKDRSNYVIEYDWNIPGQRRVVVDSFTTDFPNVKEVKDLFRKAFIRADKEDYRFVRKKKKISRTTKKSSIAGTKNTLSSKSVSENDDPSSGTVLLPGIRTNDNDEEVGQSVGEKGDDL